MSTGLHELELCFPELRVNPFDTGLECPPGLLGTRSGSMVEDDMVLPGTEHKKGGWDAKRFLLQSTRLQADGLKPPTELGSEERMLVEQGTSKTVWERRGLRWRRAQ